MSCTDSIKKTAAILNVKNTNLESLCAHPPINCLMTSLYETVADVLENWVWSGADFHSGSSG